MEEIKDYYKILNINFNSSQIELKKAYKKLVIKYHPDISKEKNATIKIQEINEAYGILSNLNKRQTYDKIYKELYLNKQIINFRDREANEDLNFKQEKDGVNHEKVYHTYKTEIENINTWISEFKSSFYSFDSNLSKSINKLDGIIENTFYYVPIVLGIMFVVFVIVVNII